MRTLLGLFLLFTVAVTAAEPVDLLVVGGTYVTMDGERRVLQDAAMAVTDGRIVALGAVKELEALYVPHELLDATDTWVIPGLINVHNHLPMILFRGVGEGADLQSWLTDFMFPLERELASNEDFICCGTRLGCWEMLRSGTTTFLNAYFLPDVTAEVCSEIGMRVVCAHGVVDHSFLNNKSGDQLLRDAQEFIQKWRKDPLVTPALSPHSPYLCGPDTLKKTLALAEEEDVLVTLHAAESRWEVETIQQRYGCTPIRHLERIGFLGPRVLLVHVIWVDEEELNILGRTATSIAHCAGSNMKLANGIPPIPAMLSRELVVALGTDSAASNNSLDMFREMDIAGKLSKVSALDASVLPAERIFAMATIEAARALRLEKQIGSLEVGKRADFVLLGRSGPQSLPGHDPYAQLVYSCDGRDVETVVVDGRILMLKREMQTLDEEAVVALVKREAQKIASLLRPKEDVEEKLVAPNQVVGSN